MARRFDHDTIEKVAGKADDAARGAAREAWREVLNLEPVDPAHPNAARHTEIVFPKGSRATITDDPQEKDFGLAISGPAGSGSSRVDPLELGDKLRGLAQRDSGRQIDEKAAPAATRGVGPWH